ncbi:hypothetical protein DL93DRAFT_2083979 [Clavulina sp. PMI_390]|nr:hypothetical protein DL93DRAFT_2083979 [Clavulina sp. PMI_390]
MVIDSCEPPPIEVSDPAEIILEQHPHRRHIIAVLFNHSTISFSYLDQAGSITSTPISIRDPRFVASIMRLIAGDRALAGYETWLTPAIPVNNRDSQGMIPAGSQIILGRTQYTISYVVDALEYDSAIYTNLFVAHPTGPGPTNPISKLLIKFSYQPSNLPREDITLRHLANNTHEDRIIRVCGAFVPVRLSDPHNFRGKLLPGGANRLYRDLELRVLILGVVDPSGPIPSGALSLDAAREVLPGLEHVILEHLPVEVVEDGG